MGFLDNVKTGFVPSPHRIFMYGPEGMGKSSWPRLAPDPIYLNLENRLGHIDCPKGDVPQNMDEVWDQLAEIRHGKHEYRTLVVDTATALQALLYKAAISHYGVVAMGDTDHGKTYVWAQCQAELFRVALEKIQEERQMNVVIIAHSEVKPVSNPAGDSYSAYRPMLAEKICATFVNWCNEVLFLNWKVYTNTIQEGHKKVVKGQGDGERVIYTQKRPSHTAKNSGNLPAEMGYALDSGWSDFISNYSFETKSI